MKTFLQNVSNDTSEAYHAKDFDRAATMGMKAIEKFKEYNSTRINHMKREGLSPCFA